MGAAQLDAHLAAPRRLPGYAQLALERGQSVGCGLARHLRLRLGAATLECAELVLAAPGGRPDVAEALIGALLPALAEAGIALIVLCGPAESYAAFGLAPFRYHARLVLPSAPGDLARAGDRVRDASEQDLEDLAALYDATYRELGLGELHTSADWRARRVPGDARVLEDAQGRVIAYARSPVGASGAIHEAAGADAGALRMLLAALLQAAPGQPLVLEGFLSAHPATHTALQLGAELRIRAFAGDEPAPLAGILDLAGYLEQLAPELERRLSASRYATWRGAVQLELGAPRVTLASAGGRISVRQGAAPADIYVRRIQLGGAAQLLLGYRSAADLRAAGALDCDNTALGLLDSLFPALPL